mmetsp:Transcript_139007/g.255634  ORF Transcript_139007/g.255634 Transcript_139007/m.255634 type:complete len:83 (+) Transcript_139007:101-349(+)
MLAAYSQMLAQPSSDFTGTQSGREMSDVASPWSVQYWRQGRYAKGCVGSRTNQAEVKNSSGVLLRNKFLLYSFADFHELTFG